MNKIDAMGGAMKVYGWEWL